MQVLRSFSNQEVLDLQEKLGRGGEACVYTVPSNENLVAKIYHHPTPNHIQKLRAMIANPPANPAASFGHISIAWPQELLTAAESSDTIIGFLMPRIRNMRPIMDFYNPGNRRQNCPLFNYQYLLRTARNLAAAFAALHASNYCIGDVNESNILVSNTALVSLVDTDSFQVPDLSQNTVYRCLVGKPEYTPPELQNKTFADYNRETYHDLFGLGVLIFQLLMEGTHPFSGVFQGLGDPPTYESRILAGHFTYSQKQKVPYLPTPITPSWQTLHPDLRDLFISCFEDGYHAPYLRPSAQTWLSVLSTAEASLVSCAVNPQHVYHPHLDKCPWCERTIKLGGRDPFPSLQAISAREHLQPRRKSRKRPRYQPRVRKPAVPVLAPYTQSSLRSTLPGYPTVQTSSRSKFYTFMFGILGLGVLGYLDIMVKFTRPFLSPNPYTQQSLLSSSSENVHSPLSLSFNDYYQRGNQAYQQQDYQQAIEDFSQGIKQNTNFLNYTCIGNPVLITLGSHLINISPLIKVCFRPPTPDGGFLRSLSELGFTLEVGPVPQGILNAQLFQQTAKIIYAILDFFENYNQGKISINQKSNGKKLNVYEFMSTVDYPRNESGDLQGMIHPQLEYKDYQPLNFGDAIFLTFDNQEIFYQGKSTVYPVFINEAAYYEKGIAMHLTQKKLVHI